MPGDKIPFEPGCENPQVRVLQWARLKSRNLGIDGRSSKGLNVDSADLIVEEKLGKVEISICEK